MPQSLYLSPSEKVCSKSSSPENSGLFLPDGKSLSKSEEFDEDRMSSDVFMSVNEEEEPILKEIPSLKRKFRSFSLQGDKKEYLEYKKKYENIEDELEEYEWSFKLVSIYLSMNYMKGDGCMNYNIILKANEREWSPRFNHCFVDIFDGGDHSDISHQLDYHPTEEDQNHHQVNSQEILLFCAILHSL